MRKPVSRYATVRRDHLCPFRIQARLKYVLCFPYYLLILAFYFSFQSAVKERDLKTSMRSLRSSVKGPLPVVGHVSAYLLSCFRLPANEFPNRQTIQVPPTCCHQPTPPRTLPISHVVSKSKSPRISRQ